jgi:formylglycine-generating enzyme required for sulfatase activity
VQVTLTHPFEIQEKETSQAEWVALGFPNPSTVSDAGNRPSDCIDPECPVGNVTIFEAAGYANALSASRGYPACYALTNCIGAVGSGMVCSEWRATMASVFDCPGFRLPTELEWEYAARAGTHTALYNGELAPTENCGQNDAASEIGWYCGNSGKTSHPRGQKRANGWGLFDMAGNAFEWVTSDFNGNGYGKTALTDPYPTLPPTDAGFYVARGGGGGAFVSNMRSAARSIFAPTARGGTSGFRLVRTLK